MVEKCLKHKPLYPYSELQYIIPPISDAICQLWIFVLQDSTMTFID